MDFPSRYTKSLETLLMHSTQMNVNRKKRYHHFLKNLAYLLNQKGFTGDEIINNLAISRKNKNNRKNDDKFGEDDRNTLSETDTSSYSEMKKVLVDNPIIAQSNLKTYFANKHCELKQNQGTPMVITHNRKDIEIDTINMFLNKKRSIE